MYRVLGIDGSPRKESTTLKLLRIATEAAAREGAEVSVLSLKEHDIPACEGCVSYNGRCNLDECEKHNGATVRKLLERIMAADVLFFATPVYWFGPSGLLKNLIDRMTCLEHEKKLLDGKIGGIMCSYEDEGASTTISQLFLTLSDMGLVFPPYAYTYNRGEDIHPDSVFYAEQLGRNAVRMAALLRGQQWWKK